MLNNGPSVSSVEVFNGMRVSEKESGLEQVMSPLFPFSYACLPLFQLVNMHFIRLPGVG